MKTKLSLKALAFLSLLLCWQVSFARDIVFTFDGYENDRSEITVDGVTLLGEKGKADFPARVYSGTWRVYKGNNMTFTAPANAQITNIIFNNNQIEDWTGKQNSVTLSNIQVSKTQKLNSITVTIAESGPALEDPACKFSTEIAICNLGETFTAPTFSTVSTGKVTYSSSNPSVATINSETGEITIGTTTGTTTITAEIAATDTHYAGSASYILAVVDPNNATYSDMKNDFNWEGVGSETMTGTAYNGLIKITAVKGENGGTNPTVNNANDVRVYANSTLAIESLNGSFLSEVVFSLTDVSRLGNMTVNQGTLSTDLENKTVTWSGYATSFTITVPAQQASGTGNAQFRFDGVSAIFASSELADPACVFSAKTASVNLGEVFTAPKFTTASNGKITYESSNKEVATVDGDGNITIVGAGTTIITAIVAATDTYAAGSASYTLTVIDPSILFSESFAESLGDFTVTQTEKVWSYNSGDKCAYANGYNKEDGQDLKLISPVIDLKDVTGASLTFEHAVDYATNHNLQTELTLWIKEKDATKWNQLIIPVYPNNKTFVNSEEISLNTYCGKEVQIAFNYTWQKKFAAAWEIKNVTIKKAEPATLTISVSDAGYATYFTDQAWVVADNMKAGIVTGVENKNLTIDWKYAAGSVVPANTAVLIQADAKEYVCEVSNSEEAAPANNLLKGSTTAATTEGENCLFYKLSYDNGGKNLGFYWAAESGAAFQNEANKAYLALTTTVAKNVRGFGLEGDGTTGIGQVENGEALVNVYTIDGIIVRKQVKESQALNDLKKGIYIVNGKKVIK